jgi:membrane associated rhomboid family serine protease
MNETDTTSVLITQLRLDGLILGAIFITIYVLRFLDGIFLKNRLANNFGVRPRQNFNLFRFISHAFLHSNRGHLFGNSFSLLILGGLTMLFDAYYFWLTTLLIIVIGGFGIWLFGQSKTNHIGVSGLILGYFGFTLSRGFFEVNSAAFLLAFIIGGAILGLFPSIFPRQPGISKAGHFFGFIGGIFAAWFTHWLAGIG